MGFRTDSIQKGVYADKQYHSATTPIYTTSTFFFEELGVMPEFDYTRSGNPTRAALEENLATLEGGTRATITCTGMSAITTALFLFGAGDHVIAGKDIYGGTYRLFASTLPRVGIDFTFVDPRNIDEIKAAIRPNTRAIWIETPSNPLLNITDIEAVVALAKEHGLCTIADNTFMSPYFQRPLSLGVDVVVQSCTKYINGHSDCVCGAVIASDPDLGQELADTANALGTTASPMEAWLVLRGVKTLAYRMEGHQVNAMRVAEFLADHPRVRKVYYPGLASHPQHELAKRQMTGFGGMVSFELDEAVNPKAFVEGLEIFRLAESLGGVESLICQPWSMTHASMPEDARVAGGITQALFRLSVGLEDAEDLVADLGNGLKEG